MVYQAVIESGHDSGSLLWIVWLAAAMMGSALTLALFRQSAARRISVQAVSARAGNQHSESRLAHGAADGIAGRSVCGLWHLRPRDPAAVFDSAGRWPAGELPR